MLVFLIGFMGAGKTSLGQALAQHLGYRFIDLDQEIASAARLSISEIFTQEGEAGFREREQDTLRITVHNLLPQKVSCIIACGGGTPCYHENLDFMKAQGFVIYLDVAPDILCERLLQQPRPLLPYHSKDELLIHIHRLLNIRQPFYTQAHWIC